MGFLSSLFSMALDEVTGNPQYIKEARKKWEQEMRGYSLTCKQCNDLAEPIPDTGNRYRCESCGNQFSAAKHGMDSWENRKGITRFRNGD